MATPSGLVRFSLAVGIAGLLMQPLTALADGACPNPYTVASGQTWVVSKTTRLCALTIESGGVIAAPSGYSVSLTVNGVETGQKLATTAGVDTVFVPGTYRGDIVLTVAVTNPEAFGSLTYPIRQGLYLDSTGVVAASSVLAAVRGGARNGSALDGAFIASTGQAFDGVYSAGGSNVLRNPQILLEGDGRSDFVGDGAAVVANGADTTLVLDHAYIRTHGVVRTAAIATGGATLIVKSSDLETRQGTLPSDYAETVNTDQMRSVPWMLGINGTDNVRATNLLGPGSKAAYINSSIASDSWGVLSSDSGSDCTLVAFNSAVSITRGGEGYGTYAIGNVTEYLLGTRFDVGSYATINTGGAVYYGNSSAAQVASLNSSLGLGLTQRELDAIREQPTLINSRRFGVMWHSSSGTVDVSGGTQINTEEDTFLDKSPQAVTITIDGSKGARLHPQNGIILQVMDDDDPGPQGSGALNDGVYVDPYFGTTNTPTRDTSFNVASTTNAAAMVFSNIEVTGNFYNSSGWTLMASSGGGGGGGPPGGGPGGPPGGATATAGEQNMFLTFTDSNVRGVISSTTAHHHVATIDATTYYELGEVTNTPSPAINNGAIVMLNGASRWTVTGTSYLTSLTLGSAASVVAASRHTLSMTVNGVSTPIEPGTTYTGAVVLTIS